MTSHLSRLGDWAFTHRRTAVAAWLDVVAVVIGCALAFGGTTNDKFTVPGAESQEAQELLEQKFPAASGTYARIAFAAPEGEKLTDPENKAAVKETVALAADATDVSGVSDPFKTGALTEDQSVGFGDVIYPVPAHEIDDAARDELADSAGPARAAGLQVEFGGGLVTEGAETGSEGTGMVIGFLVPGLTLASPRAARAAPV